MNVMGHLISRIIRKIIITTKLNLTKVLFALFCLEKKLVHEIREHGNQVDFTWNVSPCVHNVNIYVLVCLKVPSFLHAYLMTLTNCLVPYMPTIRWIIKGQNILFYDVIN